MLSMLILQGILVLATKKIYVIFKNNNNTVICRGSTDAASLAQKIAPTQKILSLGVVDGRNIWKARYAQVLPVISQVLSVLPAERLWYSLPPSFVLLVSPLSSLLSTN
jgi:hypothetical protein